MINILLVDDRPENLLALKSILNRPEYNVVSALSGREALGYLLKMEFAVILLDIFMPEMDGYEVATLVKERPRSRHTPIIFLTAGATDIQNIYRAYQIGAVDYIQKPLDADIVKAKVAVFAELYSKNQQILRQSEFIRCTVVRQKELELSNLRRQSERRVRELVEGIEEGFVWTANPDTLDLTFISDQAAILMGYPSEYWYSESGILSQHLHPDERVFVIQKFHNAQEDHETSFEHRIKTADGRELWLHTGIRLGRRLDDNELEIRGMSFDVTALKRTEEALRSAVHMRDEFLSIASHELKTPLTPMKLQIQLLQKVLGDVDITMPKGMSVVSTVATLHRQIERLNTLVDNLLDISRISAGRLNLSATEVSLHEIVNDVVQRYCDKDSSSQCEIIADCKEALIGSWDRIRLEQVLVNLITNAAKYGNGKPFQVQFGRKGDQIYVSVRDNGIGIGFEDHERIFKRFERAASATSFGGLGLGLFIADQIVRAHGGLIHVDSEVGVGSTFTFEIPLIAVVDFPEPVPEKGLSHSVGL